MKKMMLIALVFLTTQISFAATIGPKVEAQIARYAERIKQSRESLENKFDFKNDKRLAEAVKTSLDKILSKSTNADSTHLMNLMNFDGSAGKDVITKIIEQTTIIEQNKDAKAVAAANRTLELLTFTGRGLDQILPIEQTAREAKIASQREQVELALNISEQIAQFEDYTSDTAKSYALAYKTALKSGKTPRQAFEAATKIKNITEEQLKNCKI